MEISTGCKSVDLIRSAWKRLVLIVQPLQFHDRLGKRRPVLKISRCVLTGCKNPLLYVTSPIPPVDLPNGILMVNGKCKGNEQTFVGSIAECVGKFCGL